MNFAAIGLMSLAALGVWLVRSQRPMALLLISVASLYLLQPAGLEFVLPTATLLLVIGVWWLVNPARDDTDNRTLILIGITAAVLSVFSNRSAGLQSFSTLAPMAAVAIGAIGIGAVIPREGEDARRRTAIVFIVIMIAILIIVKLPALQVVTTSTLSSAFDRPILPDWQWLGFSYTSFRLMHVLLDFRNKRLQPVSLSNFALYAIFFPAITAGPIDRVEHFVAELTKPTTLDRERITSGAARIGLGLFKKFVLADSLAYFALSPSLVAQTQPGRPLVMWIMVYAYAFRLYLDFAGYSDLAIGIGILAGIKLPENFTSPYSKRSISAFWNSWHITLSTWFRSYFFTPLSRALMNTRLRRRRLWIIFIAQVSTMVLIGLWHGIAVNFILWGLWHGVGLWLHRVLTERTHNWDEYVQARPRLGQTIHILSVLTTFHFVAIGWIFFALPNLDLIDKAFAGLVGR